jgi:hypothetical protein
MRDQKELVNVDYFNYSGRKITNDARCTRETKSRIALAEAAFNKKKPLFTSKLDLNLRKKLVKCYTWSIALCGAADTWTLRKVDNKCFLSCEMCCWRRMDFSWTDRVRNKEVLQRGMGDRNIVHTIERRKADWICCILRKNCILIRRY